jgi:hypothetical protein
MSDKMVEEINEAIEDMLFPIFGAGPYEAAAQAAATIAERRMEEAYREGWHAGYATGDAGGSYSAVENDWLASDARAALRRSGGV